MSATQTKGASKMTTFFKIIAVNDDVDTCSCCGRTNLKKVAWVAQTVNGTEYDPAPFGTTCAANAVANTFKGDEFKHAANLRATRDAIKVAAKTGKPTNVIGWR